MMHVDSKSKNEYPTFKWQIYHPPKEKVPNTRTICSKLTRARTFSAKVWYKMSVCMHKYFEEHMWCVQKSESTYTGVSYTSLIYSSAQYEYFYSSFRRVIQLSVGKVSRKNLRDLLSRKKPRHPGSFLTRKSFLKSRQSLYIDVWETCNIGPREMSRNSHKKTPSNDYSVVVLSIHDLEPNYPSF